MKYDLEKIVGVQAGFKAAVDVLYDLDNESKILGYIPTGNAVEVIGQVFDYLNPHVSTRPLILTGTYGTGKSHLALVIATLLRRPIKDDLWKSLYSKIEAKWPLIARKVSEAKKLHGESYLLVYLEAEKVDWGPGFFDNALVLSLVEALKREGLEHIIPVTAFETALRRISEIKQNFSNSYSLLEQEVAKKQYYSVADLESRLRKHDKQSLNDFAEIHRLVCAGALFDKFSGVSACDAYGAAAEALRDEGYQGILLVWDEFLPVLLKLVENPLSGEALSFQKFAQKCESTTVNKIISIFISIRDIQETIDRVVINSLGDDSLRKDAEKISGRFRVMRLGTIDKETYYLMASVISHGNGFSSVLKTHQDNFLSAKGELDELKGQFQEQSISTDDCRVIVEDLYPLHPTTTLVLSKLTDRVGQRDRTVFTFLCDSGKGTFRDCLKGKEITDRDLPFILPFELEEYFLPLIRQSQDYKTLRKMIKKYDDVAAAVPSQDEAAKKIIKTILIMNAAANRCTTQTIISALGCPTEKSKRDVEKKLKALKEERKITQGLADQSWRFFGQTLDVTIDEHLREVVDGIAKVPQKELFNNSVSRVNVKEIYRFIKAENYNIDRGLDRQVALEFILSSELENPDPLRKRTEAQLADGAYYFVLSFTEDDLSTARKRIQEYFPNDSNIVFAVPTSVFQIQELTPYVKRMAALQELPNVYPQYKSELREELITEESDTIQFLRNKLNDFLDPSKEQFEIYYKGEKKEIKAINKLRELVSNMMETTFPFTPSVNREELIRNDGADTFRSRYRIPLIDTVISPKGPSLLAQENDRVKKNIIEILYKYHNILKHESGEWIISKPSSSPENNAMIHVWEEIDTFIRNADVPTDFAILVNKLKSPPYGLKLRTIGLILAPVLREYVLHNNLIMQWKGSPVDKIDGNLLEEKILLREQQVKLRFQEVTDKHKLIWRTISETYGIEEADLESAFRAIVNWWRELPAYSRNTTGISDQTIIFKEQFLEPLSAHEQDKTELINNVLPKLVGLEDLSVKTNSEIEELSKSYLAIRKQEFELALEKLHGSIKLAIEQVFGGADIMDTYYSKLPNTTQRQVFTGDANKVLEWLKDISSKDKLALNDYVILGEDILGKCENWNDEHVIRLKGHIESAINQIESYKMLNVDPRKKGSLQPRQGKVVFNMGDIQRVFTLYTNFDNAPNKEQVGILMNVIKGDLLSALKNGRITGDEFLSIIYHLIRESDSA